jgi:hypothetical protein
MSIVKGIATWAHLVEPDTRFTPAYNITVTMNTEDKDKFQAEIDELIGEDKGVKQPKITETPEGAWSVGFRKNFIDYRGNEARPIPTVDPEKRPIDGAKVGNGSLVRVIVGLKRNDNVKFGKFVSAYLNKVQVLELVEFDMEDFDDIDMPSGKSVSDLRKDAGEEEDF